MSEYAYSEEFFDYLDIGSRRSAAHVLAVIAPELRPKTVLDVGCGRGAWLAEWLALPDVQVLGVDGDYVDVRGLLIPTESFVARDVSKTFDLERRFDLVECLEVGEHLPDSSADTFVDNLARHGDLVLFSAAVPGQGGEHHINEQPYEYWRAKFAARDYRVFDFVRGATLDNREIEPWFRYNILLFARGPAVDRLSPRILSCEVPGSAEIRDVSPFLWKLRKACLRALPPKGVRALARVKHRLINVVNKVRRAA